MRVQTLVTLGFFALVDADSEVMCLLILTHLLMTLDSQLTLAMLMNSIVS